MKDKHYPPRFVVVYLHKNEIVRYLNVFSIYQALVYCNESCFFAITWALHNLVNNCDAQNQAEASSALQRNLNKYMKVSTDLVKYSKIIEIQESVRLSEDTFHFPSLMAKFVSLLFQAFKSICDLLIQFSDQLSTINPMFRKLHYISNAEQQAALNGFVQQAVFAIQEEGL